MSTISFNNAVATLKDGAVIDEAGLRTTAVYGKLMLQAGMKFDKVKSVKDFLLSDSKKFIRAELFYINKHGTMVVDQRLWLNVAIDAKIMKDTSTKMYFVELIHPVINLDEAWKLRPTTQLIFISGAPINLDLLVSKNKFNSAFANCKSVSACCFA